MLDTSQEVAALLAEYGCIGKPLPDLINVELLQTASPVKNLVVKNLSLKK